MFVMDEIWQDMQESHIVHENLIQLVLIPWDQHGKDNLCANIFIFTSYKTGFIFKLAVPQ